MAMRNTWGANRYWPILVNLLWETRNTTHFQLSSWLPPRDYLFMIWRCAKTPIQDTRLIVSYYQTHWYFQKNLVSKLCVKTIFRTTCIESWLPELIAKGRFGADRESSPDADVRRTPNTSPNTSPDTQTVTTDTQPVAKKTDAENEAALALFDLVSSVRAPTRKASPLYYPSQQTATWSAVPRQASRTGGSQTWPILELFGRHWITWQHACKLVAFRFQLMNTHMSRLISLASIWTIALSINTTKWKCCDLRHKMLWTCAIGYEQVHLQLYALRISYVVLTVQYNMQKSENKCIFFDYYHVLNLERVRTGNKYTTQQRHSGEPKTLAYRKYVVLYWLKSMLTIMQQGRCPCITASAITEYIITAKCSVRWWLMGLENSCIYRDGSDSEFEAPRRTRMYKPPSKRRGGRVVSAQHDGSDDSDTLSLSQSDEEETQFQYRRRKITKSCMLELLLHRYWPGR